MQKVTQIPFPAVTLCYDINDWKWPGIVNAMVEFDKTNRIGKLYNKKDIYKPINKMQFVELAYKKSDEYHKLLEMNHMDIIETFIAKEYQELAKFVHYVIFNEQNSTSSYYLKLYLVDIRKRQLSLKMDNNPKQVAESYTDSISCCDTLL